MSVFKITTASFEKDVVKTSTPIVVDCWAEWCGPCKKVGPVFENLSGEQSMDNVKFAKLDIEENQEVAMKLNISSIPCFIVFKNGEEKGRVFGAQKKEILKEQIEEILSR